MHYLMMIPAFLAYVFLMSLRFFGRRERRFALVSFAVLGAAGGICYFLFTIWQQIDDRPFAQADRNGAFLRLLVSTLQRLPGRLADWLQDNLGPHGVLLSLTALAVIALVGAILSMLHRNAADPD